MAALHALRRPTLLFPVEATSVTVWDVDVTVGLENGELETSQDSVEQLTTWSLVYFTTI